MRHRKVSSAWGGQTLQNAFSFEVEKILCVRAFKYVGTCFGVWIEETRLTSRREFVAGASLAALGAAVRCAAPLRLPAQSAGSPATAISGIVLNTPSGRLRGVFINGVRIFLGIPFAQPPVGNLRFRPPVPGRPWKGVRDAGHFAPSAMQSGTWIHSVHSEDCLYLNIWAPSAPGPHPVLVWVHGGGYNGGTAALSFSDGAGFADAGIVCISVAYRLGVFGFLDMEPLLGPEYAGSGCNALRDLMAAFTWVQENVAAFGGDPGRVTIGGESAGAKLTDTLMAIPSARPLFHQMISESGGVDRVWSKPQADEVAEGFLAQWRQGLAVDATGGATTPARIRRDFTAASVLTAPASDLVAVQRIFLRQWPRHFPLRPEVDGVLLREMPQPAIRAGSSRGKHLLIGTNREESALFVGPHPEHDPSPINLGNMTEREFMPVFEQYRRIYPEMPPDRLRIRALTAEEYWVPSVRVADAAVKGGVTTWMYLLDFTQTQGRLKGYAFHSLDLPLVFDKANPLAGNVAAEAQLATQVHAAWVSFIHGKAPAGPGLPKWSKYKAGSRPTMILNVDSRVEKKPQDAELQLWKGLL
jgi:para-nitrobenzyl esterase